MFPDPSGSCCFMGSFYGEFVIVFIEPIPSSQQSLRRERLASMQHFHYDAMKSDVSTQVCWEECEVSGVFSSRSLLRRAKCQVLGALHKQLPQIRSVLSCSYDSFNNPRRLFFLWW